MRRGIGASCTVIKRYLHPKATVNNCQEFFNLTEASGLIITGCGSKKIRGKQTPVIFFRHSHESLENVQLYCATRYAKVITEGAPEHFFETIHDVAANDLPNDVANNEVSDSVRDSVSDGSGEGQNESSIHSREITHDESAHLRPRGTAEDIANIHAMGFTVVDDDNEPVPENIPGDNDPAPANHGLYENQAWHDQYIDPRTQNGVPNINPSLPGMQGKNPQEWSFCEVFELFFGVTLLNMIVDATNAKLPQGKVKISKGEMLRFVGLWLLMVSTSVGYTRADYWSSASTRAANERKVPYDFNNYMSPTRFDLILRYLWYTDDDPPPYCDGFWQVRKMIGEWNDNMKTMFIAAWVVCLDESMSIWTNRWTCPGWMYVPRKPHTMGNEYHTICCGLSRILFHIDLCEGDDHPPQLPSLNPRGAGMATVSLLLHMCTGIFHSGRVVILDSGFCVVKGIVELYRKGLYAGALIKKRRYWPKHVPGDKINEKMKLMKTGETKSIAASLDGVKYSIFAMKEPDYVSKIMATYGSLAEVDDGELKSRREKQDDGTIVKQFFRYTTTFANHFHFRHAVDDHNNHRHQIPSVEETWTTIRWENRVFAFIITISEVNTWLAFRYFVWKDSIHGRHNKPYMTLLNFRIQLGMQLINNPYLPSAKSDECVPCKDGEKQKVRCSKRLRMEIDHEFATAPKYAKQFSTDGRWILGCKDPYQKKVCSSPNCKNRVRTYCSCNIGHWQCVQCWGKHLVEVAGQLQAPEPNWV